MKLPNYKIIQNYILNLIEKKEFIDDDQLPSENELSHEFGVSRVTVRKALDELVAKNILYRVQGIGTFVSPRRDIIRKSKYIGVILSYFVQDYITMGILRGVEDFLSWTDYTPIFQYMRERTGTETQKLKKLRKKGIRAFIIMPTIQSLKDSEIRELIGSGEPIVFVDRKVEGLDGISVESDNFRGGYECGKHFLYHNVHSILFIASEGFKISSVRDRYEGLVEGLKSKIPTEHLILEGASIDDMDLTPVLEKIKRDSIDAVFCCNDIIAFRMINLMKLNGIDVPEDVKVIGFDDRDISKYVLPPLTTVQQHPYKLGYQAASVLLSLLSGNLSLDSNTIRVPVEFKVRKSCGCSSERKQYHG
ncbi:MAG: substrate-binding domain-containing protein [Thermotogae bacterium]|nr:substrate-binding domain-containing protein [Thermotogota bacterium]